MQVVQETLSHAVDTTALLSALNALKKGDFSARLPVDWTGVSGKVADTFNEVVELNERMAKELERLSPGCGKEGKLSQRASLGDVRQPDGPGTQYCRRNHRRGQRRSLQEDCRGR